MRFLQGLIKNFGITASGCTLYGFEFGLQGIKAEVVQGFGFRDV